MKYANANDVLPACLVEELLRHVDGCMLYVPQKTGSRKAWGAATGAKQELAARNAQIRKEHAAGAKLFELSDRFGLSPDTIRKIIYSR
ncbi:MAG TPA: CD3324 family protein [Clostridia bacterium]|nr:CD3324 family protein [Clostridia bacterium]